MQVFSEIKICVFPSSRNLSLKTMLYQAVKHSSLPKAQTKTEERFVKVILLDSLT